jgi:hypothetical protein
MSFQVSANEFYPERPDKFLAISVIRGGCERLPKKIFFILQQTKIGKLPITDRVYRDVRLSGEALHKNQVQRLIDICVVSAEKEEERRLQML